MRQSSFVVVTVGQVGEAEEALVNALTFTGVDTLSPSILIMNE